MMNIFLLIMAIGGWVACFYLLKNRKNLHMDDVWHKEYRKHREALFDAILSLRVHAQKGYKFVDWSAEDELRLKKAEEVMFK